MRTFYEDSRRLSKRSLNIHMSQVNFDKQYQYQHSLCYVVNNGMKVFARCEFNDNVVYVFRTKFSFTNVSTNI